MRNRISLALLVAVLPVACSPELHEIDERAFAIATEPTAPVPPPPPPPAPEQPKLPEPPPPPPPPKPPETVELFMSAPALSGPINQTTEAYRISAAFDFDHHAAVPGVFQVPITLPPEASDAKSITLTYRVSADATWGPTASWCASQGFPNRNLVEKGTDHACVQPGAKAGLSIDGAFDGRNAGTLSTLLIASQSGVSYPVTTASKVFLRLEVVGDVELRNVAATVTATMTF